MPKWQGAKINQNKNKITDSKMTGRQNARRQNVGAKMYSFPVVKGMKLVGVQGMKS